MNAFSAEIDRAVEDVRRHYLVPGLAIAVVRGGDVIHVGAYGLRNTAGTAAADIDTAFAIGSCSKAFTCALAAALVDERRLGWDDRVRTYLPAFQLHDPWISDHLTIRDLLANRTGLSRASVGEYGSDLSRPDLLQRARFIPPVCGFRDQLTYSNVGYAAAAEVIAELSGRTFNQLMDHHVLQVLQMTASRVGNPSSSQDNIAAPHYKFNGVVQPVPPMSTDNLLSALSQMLSVRDAARWGHHLREAIHQRANEAELLHPARQLPCGFLRILHGESRKTPEAVWPLRNLCSQHIIRLVRHRHGTLDAKPNQRTKEPRRRRVQRRSADVRLGSISGILLS